MEVIWTIFKDDIDLIEDIKDFMEDVGIEIKIKYYENEA